MKTVIIESPYKGYYKNRLLPDFIVKIVNFFVRKRNIKYAKECMIDSLNRNETPFLSHLLYTQVLDDNIDKERELGINCNIEWHNKADMIIFYTDYGLSEGMKKALGYDFSIKKEIKIRHLYGRKE